jgi:hypothetical protein
MSKGRHEHKNHHGLENQATHLSRSPAGTHKVSTVLYNGKIVTGYHIDVTVPTVVNGKIVDMNDYFIHATTSSYTFGCAGVRSDWDRFEDTMATEREGAVITIHNRKD